MGQVYRARDRVLERTVAIKVLSAAATQDLELVARFGREARAAAALNHPNIVTVFDSGAGRRQGRSP
jgi:serine/threonine-protein kinase